MANPVAWSYSRIKGFEQCPRKFWNESVAKTIPFEKSEQMEYGDYVHKSFELFLKRGTELPLPLLHWAPMLGKIVASPGQKIVEQQIALNARWEPVEWYAKDTWLRVKSDLTQVSGANAVVWDWKTGKQDDDWTQLKLNAAVTFHLDPRITHITMVYGWLKDKEFPSKPMSVGDVPDFWAAMLPRVAKYQEAHDKQDFPPKPNYLCKKYCRVKTCQYNGA